VRISCPFAIIVLKNKEKHTKKQEKRERKKKTEKNQNNTQKKQKQKTTYAGIAKLICMHMANEPTPEVMQCRVTRL